VTLSRDLTTPRQHRAYRACYYCGAWCRGLTCRNCQDLLALDPNTAKGIKALSLTEPEQGRDTGTVTEEVPQDARTSAAGAAPTSGSVSDKTTTEGRGDVTPDSSRGPQRR
jgi:hypothetical protein